MPRFGSGSGIARRGGLLDKSHSGSAVRSSAIILYNVECQGSVSLMPTKVIEMRRSRAQRFLVSLAASVPGPQRGVATEDIEATARKVADYFASRVAEGDLDSILQVLDDTLKHETEARITKPDLDSPPGPTRDDELDPSYYFG
jgi:hypothetical protein